MTAAICVLLVWNLVVFIFYGADKRKAQKGRWRISEGTLIVCAFLLGGIGALLGMSIFRHKTRRWKFRILVPLAVLANAAALYGIGILLY